MPLLRVHTSSQSLDDQRVEKLLTVLSATLARELGKPESYVMTILAPPVRMTFAGTSAPACFAEVKNVGALSAAKTAHLSEILCRMLSEGLGVTRERTYIEFTTIEPHLWGWNGDTFA